MDSFFIHSFFFLFFKATLDEEDEHMEHHRQSAFQEIDQRNTEREGKERVERERREGEMGE